MKLSTLTTKELYTLLAAAKGLTALEAEISNELNTRVKLARRINSAKAYLGI